MFRYSSIWGTWSRVLSKKHSANPHVEINLTPIPRCTSSSWNSDVVPVCVRCHVVTIGNKDVETYVLPDYVRKEMVENLGEELTNRLLTEDFLPQIDYGLYVSRGNCMARLEDIKKRI